MKPSEAEIRVLAERDPEWPSMRDQLVRGGSTESYALQLWYTITQMDRRKMDAQTGEQRSIEASARLKAAEVLGRLSGA
jgi:hypothetical protein